MNYQVFWNGTTLIPRLHFSVPRREHRGNISVQMEKKTFKMYRTVEFHVEEEKRNIGEIE